MTLRPDESSRESSATLTCIANLSSQDQIAIASGVLTQLLQCRARARRTEASTTLQEGMQRMVFSHSLRGWRDAVDAGYARPVGPGDDAAKRFASS